jgi:hypothetical protein
MFPAETRCHVQGPIQNCLLRFNTQLQPSLLILRKFPRFNFLRAPVFFGGQTTLEEKAGGATQQYFERNDNFTTPVPLLVAPVVSVPGFGDGTIMPTPAPNWNNITQQLEAWFYLPFAISTGDELDDGATDPPFAAQWINKRGTGRPPFAPNWIDRALVRPPPAPNWLINISHRSHLCNNLPSLPINCNSASMQYSSVYWEVKQSISPNKETVLAVLRLVLRPLEQFGIRVRWILAMFSGVWVQILLPPAHLSNTTLYESQSSEICTSEHGIDKSLLGLTPRVSTTIDNWQSCFGFCWHGDLSLRT